MEIVLVVLLLISVGISAFLASKILNLKNEINLSLDEKLNIAFNHQREINRLTVAEVVEEKFRTLSQGQQTHFQNLIDRFSMLQQNVSKDLFNMSEKLNKDLETKLNEINDRVKANLDQGFKKTNETFNSVIERLAKIDEAQKKIEQLSSNVVSLQDVLTDKKSRGIFGEVQLNQVLSSVFGEKNDRVYQLQYKLSNGTMCDSILFLPEPTGKLVVDSKFPLENFRRMFDQNLNDVEKKDVTRDFKNNLKKHIDDISSKYIISGETADQAVLFLPAEAIFAELYAYHGDVIEYAHQKRVWITSPTTFMAMLTTVQVVLNNIERSKYTNVIHQELNKLAEEFSRYKKRWDNLASHIDTVSKDVKEIHTTTEKITTRFSQISEVKIDHLLDS
jgi:DNA recombination protein RmuC